MNVLLIGSGGREHALAWAISGSPALTRFFCAPGNAGIAACAEIVALDVTDHAAITSFCQDHAIDLVVVGPEAPLVAGLADDLLAAGISVFGPSKAAAALEGSKAFMKEICAEAGIPTAGHESFTEVDAAKTYIAAQDAPIVVKQDGLAAGKGVIVAATRHEALEAVDTLLTEGQEILVEEFLEGEEVSVFALSDGKTVLPLASAQDHKRAFDGDEGPNTGGMGAYSPAPIMDDALSQKVLDGIIRPTAETMAQRGTPYVGVLYAGLMVTSEGPKLLEYNVRFGDPECQVLMPRLKDDILLLMKACADGVLDTMSARWYDEPAVTVVLATKGYPGAVEKGSMISGLDAAETMDDIFVFHAGTKVVDGRIEAHGGRVLAVTALGDTVTEAQAHAYEAVDAIDWPEGFCRRDIGWRAILRERDAS
jgi:phosphoribosylamine--glycine ligase